MNAPPKHLSLLSHAKVNWFLRVLDRRQDGYHNLETVFQELELSDEFDFERQPENGGCVLQGFPADIDPQVNLVRRAWELLRQRFPGKVHGIRVHVNKRIPRGGGLGGGSSNAATTLLALNTLYEVGLSADEMQILSAELGSDVPFFIRGGCAIGRGRGELLEPISRVPAYHLLLVFPPHGVSTGEAYGRLGQAGPRAAGSAGLTEVVHALSMAGPSRLAKAIHNDFEAVMRAELSFQQTISALDEAGCLRAFLCGSGSTVAGLAKDKSHCVEMSERLGNILDVAQCITCTLAGCAT